MHYTILILIYKRYVALALIKIGSFIHSFIQYRRGVIFIFILLRHYTPCLKITVQNCFCQNFVKFPPILIIFWQKDGKEANIMWDALIFHLT